MGSKRETPRNIDEYIAGFPDEVRPILEKVRAAIRKAAPDAEETISYRIPAFTLNGLILVYFAGHRKHIGLYPAPRGIAAFKKELSAYAGGKGTVRFPYDDRIPLGLIGKIVKFRVRQTLERAKRRLKKK